VTVAVPTVRHLAAAEPLLKRNIACLIEKPLAPTSAEARKLVALAAEQGVALQVGHTERFNPAVRAVAAMNVTPRFMEVHRISPMTFRSLDVGVVMDMMIHDLDIVLSLAGSRLERVEAAGVAVLGEHEDVANARLVFANGCVANITASRLALKTERKLRVFSETAYVSLDYQKRTGILIRKSDNDQALADVREQIRSGSDLSSLDYSNLISVDELAMEGEGNADPLTAELVSFLDCVRHGGKPVVDGHAGVAAVEAAERVVAAIASHKWEGLTVWDV
jgi:predicted dehydrogenase